MRVLRKQEIEDLLVGAKILGCGGGGEIEWARPLIEEVYAKGKEFKLLDSNDLPDEEISIIVGAVGGGVSKEVRERLVDLEKMDASPELVAKNLLSEYIGKEPYAYLASEIGAGNTIVPMYVAAMTDSFAVDADCCGRAKPEISISTTNVMGLTVTPLTIVSPFGDTMILKEAVNDSRAEDICRYMATASGGVCSVARCPTKGEDLRKAIVPGSISETIDIGEHVRQAKESGENVVKALMDATDGVLLFQGCVNSFERKEEGSFMWGKIAIDGTGDFQQQKLEIWFKNEFLVSWRDGDSFVTCPDTICVVDAHSAEGLSNWGDDFSKGRMVVVFGRRAHDLWRTERGLEFFSPKHFGFDIEYVPLEKITV